MIVRFSYLPPFPVSLFSLHENNIIQYSVDGIIWEGEWKNGKLWNGTVYEKDGTIYGKYVNGIPED